MKHLLLPLLLVVPSAAFAEACPKLEYAELKDMKKEELQARYCELKRYQASKKNDADAAAHSGQLVAFQLLQYSFQCESEAKRTADLMQRSFNTLPADCGEESADSEVVGSK